MPDDFHAKLQAALVAAKEALPEQFAAGNITEAGPMGQFFLGEAYGSTNPITGGVVINPATLANRPQKDVTDTLIHELQHRKQQEGLSPLQRASDVIAGVWHGITDPKNKDYWTRPAELDARQAANDYDVAHGVPMPNYDVASGVPIPGDIALPQRTAYRNRYGQIR